MISYNYTLPCAHLENQNRHRVFAILFALIVLFPSTVQVLHALENHEHVTCTAKNVKHIHQQNDDCSIFHTTVNNGALLIDNFEEAIVVPIYFERIITTTQVNSLGFFKLKSSRAPPIFS